MYKKLLLGSAIVASTLSLQANNLEELNAKVDALTEELANLQDSSSDALKGLNGSSTFGSSIDKFSVGGYGEVNYNHNVDSKDSDTLDMTRVILYVGYQFTDDIKFVSEVEWEHGGLSDHNLEGEVIVEQAFLDFRLNKMASIKVGHLLVPMGYVNVYHEPTAFSSSTRPEVERYIIPSTWHENGAIVHGSISNFDYQVGIVAGLNANNGTEIRGMRQSGKESKVDNFAFVGRLDYKNNSGFDIGASLFTGEADQGEKAFDGVKTTISEIHAGYSMNGIKLRGLYAKSKVDDAKKVAIAHGKNASGESSGYYLTASYELNQQWRPFVQYEKYNRFDETFAKNTGAVLGSGKDVSNKMIGVNFFPTKNVVLKADYNFRDNQGIDDNRFEMALGYVF